MKKIEKNDSTYKIKEQNLELHMDVPKKRIPRAEFHEIILNFMELPIKWKVRISA